MQTQILKINSADDAIDAAGKAAAVLRDGGIVAFPTETVYGLAAASGTDAVERLRELKNRPDRPFTVHIGRLEQAMSLIDPPPYQARCLMRKAWPGPLTILLPAVKSLDAELLADGYVGLRLPDNPTARLMLAAVNSPVVAPSANFAGEAPPTSCEQAMASFDGKIEMAIDDGPTDSGISSTIVRFDAEGSYKILREGVITDDNIKSLSMRRVLFVCTGNTCRSPMAEGLARAKLAEIVGCDVSQLRQHDWDIISAGTGCYGHYPATDHAIGAAAALGADIAGHLSQPANEELINSADLIFCMTEGHLMQVLQIAPSASERVMLLDETGNVPDPIGGPAELYQRTAQRIDQAIDRQMKLVTGL